MNLVKIVREASVTRSREQVFEDSIEFTCKLSIFAVDPSTTEDEVMSLLMNSFGGDWGVNVDEIRRVDTAGESVREAVDADLQTSADSWVEDRLENQEALMFSEFVQFMVSNGYERADILTLKSKMMAMYNEGKASAKANPIKSVKRGAW